MNLQQKSYLYGLFLTDGYLVNQNGNEYLSIELKGEDKDFLENLSQYFQSHLYSRTRNTNFKRDYSSTCLTITDSKTIKEILQMGFPKKDKTIVAAPPQTKYSEKDFWRGVIDGDGSLGIRKAGIYLNLTTKSESLKEAFVILVEKITGFKMNVHRNVRDNIYNLTIVSHKAQKIIKWIYEDCDLNFVLPRKYNKYLEIKDITIKQNRAYERWTEEEVKFLIAHTNQECIKFLNRTETAIIKKRKALKRKEKIKNE